MNIFEGTKISNKRTRISKSGFRTKNEAYEYGLKAYNDYVNGETTSKEAQMSYSDYLDYWMKELLARIKDIRSSEKVIYRQVLNLYATAIDYNPKDEKYFQNNKILF